MTATIYDDQVNVFLNYKENNPLSKYTEQLSLAKHLGSVAGLRILDVGCGFGYHDRWIKETGAASIVGVDISEQQILCAKYLETKDPKGIEFHVANCEHLEDLNFPPNSFDCVISTFCLMCAPGVSTLKNIFRGVSSLLKHGGRFVGVYTVPVSQAVARKYNYGTNFDPEKHPPGSLFDAWADTEKGMFRCKEIYITRGIMQECVDQAGLVDLQFLQPLVSPLGIQEQGEDFWTEFLDLPIHQYFQCKKP